MRIESPKIEGLTPALMIQGAGAQVGKSLIVAGLARAFQKRGLKVTPFAPLTLSRTTAVTTEAGEIGHVLALQARAAGLAPERDMNPILLQPEGEGVARLVVQGERQARMSAQAFQAKKAELMPRVLESFARIARGRDLVLVEGAGSTAEIGQRAGDIANMGFAQAANLPVVIVADGGKGTAAATLIGTQVLLDFTERMRVKGIIINKFAGDARRFAPARDVIAGRTGWRSFGMLPRFEGADRLPLGDGPSLVGAAPRHSGAIRIAVLKLPHIVHSDDFDPLAAETDVLLDFIAPGRAIPGDADLVIIPGSQATLADLAALRETGWPIDLAGFHRRGGRILGIGAGYQMLGTSVADPDGVEGPPETLPGLGLLDVQTMITPGKVRHPVTGAALGMAITGTEAQIGTTTGPDTVRPMLVLAPDADVSSPLPLGERRAPFERPLDVRSERPGGAFGGGSWVRGTTTKNDGAISRDGLVMGCTVHGLFTADGFRGWFLSTLREGRGAGLNYDAMIEETLDALASHLEAHLDLDALLAVARGEVTVPAAIG